MVPTETSLDFGAYLEQISETYKKLYETRQFSNVILVTDDHHHIPAHKFILSSSSKMFRKILDNLSEDQVNPLIILKGIKKDNLNAMLQYCYLGHVSLEKSHLEEFLFCIKEFELFSLQDDSSQKINTLDDCVTPFVDVKTKVSNEKKLDTKHDITDDHVANIPEEKVYICDICSHKAPTKQFLKDHFLALHKDMEPFRCKKRKCQYKCFSREKLDYHFKTKHPIVHECELCKAVLSTGQALRLHMQGIHEQVRVQCEQCTFTCSPSYLKIHIESKHEGKLYYCDMCEHTTHKKILLKRHIQAMHTDIKPFMCDRCDYKCSRKEKLKLHIHSEHEDGKLGCEQCDFKTARAPNLREHIQNRHTKEISTCDHCQFSTTSKRNFTSHVKVCKKTIDVNVDGILKIENS